MYTAILIMLSLFSISPLECITDRGEFAFSDGSSLYTFHSDGSFLLEPLGMSGRTIEGTWTSNGDNRFEVEGTWGWVNGISPENDRRRMLLYISLLSTEPEGERGCMGAPVLLWNVYFTVEELQIL